MSTFKERLIAGASILGTAAACIAIGYSLGKDTNDGLLNFLREKNQAAEKTEGQLRTELSALKLELQAAKSPPPSSVAASAIVAASPAQPAAASAPVNVERVVLQQGQTATPFGGKIAISLVGVEFEGTPMRHKAIATIGAPGKANQLLDKVDVGASVIYQGYEVRVVSTGTLTATFLVTQLVEKS